MKRKDLFKTRLLSLAALCGLMLALASCANEEIAQNTTDSDSSNDKNLATFTTGTEPETRTSLDYNTGAFYWQAGDYIYVQDDNNVWQKSSNAPTAKTDYFKFKVPGKFTTKTSYKVYYPGRSGINNQVTISTVQSQTTPNTTAHFGESGDCGTGEAKNVGSGLFSFKLDHQVSYLVFQPFTTNTFLHNCYITKIEVISNNDIAAKYKLDSTTGEITGGENLSKQIILNTKDLIWGGANPNGLPLSNSTPNIETNGAYMIIRPGLHMLKVRYWIKDIVSGIEGAITKNLSSFKYEKNTYYDMIADLKLREYDGYHYYAWDAQQNYWAGHEWDTAVPWQPSVSWGNNTNFPQNNSDPRYCNSVIPPLGTIIPPQTALFKTLPNANELSWYIEKGNPCWDENELWITMGHIYKGGVWFKKKKYIAGFSKNLSTRGQDIQEKLYFIPEVTPSLTLPDASESSKYFFLPALGVYINGTLSYIGEQGRYWSCNPYQGGKDRSYYLYLRKDRILMGFNDRTYGYRAQPFSYFGDE